MPARNVTRNTSRIGRLVMRHRTVLAVAATAAICTTATAGAASLITGAEIKNGTITSRDVKNGSLTASDFKNPASLRGPAGPQGPAGPAGQNGATGTALAGTVTYPETINGPIATVAPGETKHLETKCPPVRPTVLSGGYQLSGDGTAQIIEDVPDGNVHGWIMVVKNIHATEDFTIKLTAICAG